MGLPHHVAIRFSRTGKGIQCLSFLGEKRCSNHAVVLRARDGIVTVTLVKSFELPFHLPPDVKLVV